MRLQRAYTVPKANDLPNEDRHASEGHSHALSDGASISYNSALWAQIICARYVLDPRLTLEWLNDCIAEFSAHHDRSNMPWYKEAAFERGSFASLLGVKLAGDTIRIDAIGDSIAVLYDGESRVDSFPYRAPDEFDNDPVLLCTAPTKNPPLGHGEPTSEQMCEWSTGQLKLPRLLCMTDALGHWLLSSANDSAASRLFSLAGQDEFASFVAAEREAGAMKRDDTTLLVFW